jgi:POT family proton-dependent oligopeptide transporter
LLNDYRIFTANHSEQKHLRQFHFLWQAESAIFLPNSPKKPTAAGEKLMTADESTIQNPASSRGFFGHPIGLSTLFATEMWERFSYYGIRPLLVLFMSTALMNGGFGFERPQASAIVGIYAASVYLASLPGGWIADRLFGLRRAIQVGAILITSGHLSIGLASFGGVRLFFFLGLILIVLGTGLLKPNISAIVGDLYPEGGARRDAGFSIFYMGINLGATIGQLITGLLGEQYGYHWGFGAAGVGMLFGLLWFTFRSRSTLGNIGVEPTRDPDPAKQVRQERTVKASVGGGLAILATVIILAATGVIAIDPQAVGSYMTYVLVGIAVAYFAYLFIFGGLLTDEKKRILVIFVLFIAASIFWAAFEQAPTSLQLFAKDFTQRQFGPFPTLLTTPVTIALLSFVAAFTFIAVRLLTKGVSLAAAYQNAIVLIVVGIAALIIYAAGVGFEAPATWFQSVNSAFIIIFAPVFAALWTWLASRNINISSPVKFALGLALAGVGFLLMVFPANMLVAAGGALKVSALWLVFSYLFQTFGELSLSPVGLSSMTKLSPRRYVGQMMGVWFLASSLGNLVAGLVGGNVDPEKLEQTPTLFSWTTIALFVSAAVLAILAIPIARMMRNVEDEKFEAAEPA